MIPLNKRMNGSLWKWVVTKSLDNFNSKAMTIVTWSKTMVRNTLWWTTHTTHSKHSFHRLMMMVAMMVVSFTVFISFYAIASIVLVFVCIIFHFTCIDQICVCFLSCLRHNDDGSKREKKLTTFTECCKHFGIIWVNIYIAYPFDTIIIILYPWHLYCFDMLRIQTTTIANKENT